MHVACYMRCDLLCDREVDSCSRVQAPIQNIIYHVQSNKGVHPEAGTFAGLDG